MKYVALLRGIGPGNPNMHGAKLKELFEGLGFKNVIPVISSGNVVFESGLNNTEVLEKKIEKALPLKLGFNSSTIIRSQDDLRKLIARDPYKGVKDERPNYLLVTFFKDRREELCSVIDLSGKKTPDFMTKLDKEFSKQITSRTWKTVHRILKAMDK